VLCPDDDEAEWELELLAESGCQDGLRSLGVLLLPKSISIMKVCSSSSLGVIDSSLSAEGAAAAVGNVGGNECSYAAALASIFVEELAALGSGGAASYAQGAIVGRALCLTFFAWGQPGK
jgi:hypothetical protein